MTLYNWQLNVFATFFTILLSLLYYPLNRQRHKLFNLTDNVNKNNVKK